MSQSNEPSPAPRSARKASETLLALTQFNSWRRGDETIEMPSPSDIGATIDDAVNLLRKYDDMEREVRRLREALDSLAYWSRNRTETRISLRDRITALIAEPNTNLSDAPKDGGEAP